MLLIGTTSTETHFLPESELPECARLAYGPEGREDAPPEEMADRELAEALQRSIQESGEEGGGAPWDVAVVSPHTSLCFLPFFFYFFTHPYTDMVT